jgi:hypothetical protein
MGRDINLTDESVPIAIENMRSPSPLPPPHSDISARVVARQIQTALALVYKDLLRKVLEGLEIAYKSDTRLSAAIAFCTNILLCLVVSELQTVFDGLNIYKVSREGQDPIYAAKISVESCRAVDDVLTFYSWTVFFKNGQRYNPIKDSFPIHDVSDQDDGLASLADDFQRIMRDLGTLYFRVDDKPANAAQKTTLQMKR